MTKRILLVEHDKPTCRMLHQQLTQHGYGVVIASDGGDEGILMAVTESPDLILVATDLPVIDGWQAIKILKASTVTQQIPVMALMSPLTTSEEWGKISESGCDDYELKPVDLTSVLDKINALLDPSPALGQRKKPAELNQPLFQNHLGASPISSEVQSLKRLSEATGSAGAGVSGESMVVYVDDSPVDSQAMAKIVRNAGYGYDNITEPLEAIPILLELRPKLIFLDLVMPYTNGYELCAQIRRTSTFKKTPIIFVTNNDGIIDRVRARFVGASGFFSKPVREKRVLKVLQKHLVLLQTESSFSPDKLSV